MAVKKLRLRESENGSIRSLIKAVQNRIDELEFEQDFEMEESLTENTPMDETGSLKDLMRAVRSRINELDSDYTTEAYNSGSDLEDFQGYEFDPNSSWETIYDDVINPIINGHLAHIGVAGYTQQEAEDDIDAIINIFDDEFGTEYPNVHKACMRFWTGY